MNPRSVFQDDWFDLGNQKVTGAHALASLRDLQRAINEWRRRNRSQSGVGDTDIVALQIIFDAEKDGLAVSPRDLSERLGITFAATTMLIDRLEASGHIRRERHPSDRRSVILRPVSLALEPYPALAALRDLISAEADALTPDEAGAVASFLGRLADGVGKLGVAELRKS
jgi:DNA-binding MarR family transcriptional regulator